MLTEKDDLGDVLHFEEDNRYSRDVVTVVSGAGVLEPGHVLGRITASGKYTPSPATGADGSQTAVAVLIEHVDASAADATAVVVAREATVNLQGLKYHDSVDDAAKRAAKRDQLAAVGILSREGA